MITIVPISISTTISANHKDMGCTQRDDGPKEVRNHHAPLTPRSTQSTGLFERTVYSREFQTLRDAFYKRVFRGEGATANSRVI